MRGKTVLPAPPRFLLFDPTGESWPGVPIPQVAFAGRSNVGKSSLLNALVGRKRLAHVSRTPGRTRGLAFFEVEGRFAFVDLPGYGYAKVSRGERAAWKALVEGYLSTCRLLRKVYLLVDVRRGPQEEERMLATYLSSRAVPFRWVGMKVDKLSASERAAAVGRFADPSGGGGAETLLVSAATGEGIERLWRDIRSSFSA